MNTKYTQHKTFSTTVNKRLQPKNTGFTIVEIMIATLVFATVLVLITIGVISFTHTYYRGINQSATQNTARTIIEDVSQAIQFSGGTVVTGLSGSGGWKGVCVGNQSFNYLLGKQLVDGSAGTNQTKQALLTQSGTSDCHAENPSGSGGTELLSPHMRLSKFSVTANGDLYTIDVKVVYGDDDLLRSPSRRGPTAGDVVCNIDAGSQFCATSELITSVVPRVNPK